MEAVTVSKNKYVGRPPKFRTKEEIQEKIDAYFKECDGELLMDDNGNPVCTPKTGLVYIKPPKPPTVTGLALALGFASRQSLMEYQGKKEFNDTITRAKTRVEQYAEERLFDRDGSNGAKFSLSNNFSGWGEKPPSDLDEEEQRARIAQIKAQTDKLKGTDNDAELSRLDEVLGEIKGVV